MEDIRKLMNKKIAKISSKKVGESLAQTAPAPVSMFPPITQNRRVVILSQEEEKLPERQRPMKKGK
jgi:hypothetical protein